MAVWGALSGISWSCQGSLHQSWSEAKGYLSEVWAEMQGWRLYLSQGGTLLCRGGPREEFLPCGCPLEESLRRVKDDPGLAEGSGAQDWLARGTN